MPNPWDAGSAKLLAVARLRGAGHHQRRLRGDAGPARRIASPATRRWPTPRRSSRPPSCRCRPTWRTASPTTRPAWPTPSNWRSRRGWPGARWRTSPGDRDDPIYDAAAAAERVAAAAEAAHARCGPPRAHGSGARTTCTAGPTWPTRSPGCSRSRRRAPTCCTHRGSTTLTTSGASSTSVDRPVNVLALPGGPRVAELAPPASGRVSVGGAFAYAALGAVVDAARELREEGTYGFWTGAGVGMAAARTAFRP